MKWWMLRRKFHVSWLIAIGCASLVVGVFWAQFLTYPVLGSISWLLIGITLTIFACFRQQIGYIFLAIIGGCLIGLWRGTVEQANLAVYQKIYGSNVILRGQVSEDISAGKRGDVILRLGNNEINQHPIGGKTWVTIDEKIDIKRGDIVTVEGELEEGFGAFASSIHRAELVKVQRPEPGDVARRVRDWFASAVRRSIPEPEASLGIGYLVGQRRTLPPELSEALKIAGLTHIVVASGYNLTILVRLARRLFEKISKYLATVFSASLIFGFVAITGLSPSMSRAGLIAGLSLAAWYYGRNFHPLVLLPFAAAITLLVDPSFAWGNLGWQLSFAAFAGVMILAPLAQRYFFGDARPSTVRQILGETIAAQLATLPLLIMMFGQFSNVAIVANLLVLPLVPLAMLLTFVAGLGSLLLPAIAEIIGLPALWLLQYMVFAAESLAGLPWALSEVSFGAIGALVGYGLLAGLCIFMWKQTGYSLRNANIVE